MAAKRPHFQRPARLELNNSGSWKIVCRLDATDNAIVDEAMDCAETLTRIDSANRWRICTDDSSCTVLLRYVEPAKGWEEA